MKLTRIKPLKNTAERLNISSRRYASALILLLTPFSQACGTRSYQGLPEKLEPFEPDGCSCVPDGPQSNPELWLAACTEHDRLYWQGGSRRDRLNADLQLKALIKKSGYPLTSKIYFIGTRFGGTPYLPTPWRWGFGHPWPGSYRQPLVKLSNTDVR